jgi:hypothetical protein
VAAMVLVVSNILNALCQNNKPFQNERVCFQNEKICLCIKAGWQYTLLLWVLIKYLKAKTFTNKY